MKNQIKKFRNILAALALILLVIPGCYYDNFEAINPAAGLVNNCDTTSAVTFTKQVMTVFTDYCNSCHSSSAKNGNVALDTYTGVMNSKTRIIGSMRHSAGYKSMPPGISIDECSIRMVEMWLNKGGLND